MAVASVSNLPTDFSMRERLQRCGAVVKHTSPQASAGTCCALCQVSEVERAGVPLSVPRHASLSQKLYFFLFIFLLPCLAFAQGPPQITTQPQSLTVTQGTSATFMVEASSITY